MEYLIQQFLKQNNLTGKNGIDYSLRDDGKGAYIDKWNYEIPKPKFTQEQFDKAVLEEAKDSKLSGLNKFYNSSECWIYTVYIDVRQYASLTRDADFFAKLLPSCGGKQIQVFDDNNVIIQYDLSVEKANNLNYQINAINGILVKAKKLNLENRINLATNIDDITNIDYQKELLNAVERKINLDSIK